MNTIFKNLIKAIGIMCYFIILNFAYQKMNVDRLFGDIEVFSGMFLVLGILMLERAYKNDDGKDAISGIELLVLSLHSLSIMHVIEFFKYNFISYLVISAFVFTIYYILKAVVTYTLEKRRNLKNMSDISEIVKNEPIKKEATKKEKQVKAESKKEEKVTKKAPKEEKTKKRTTRKTKATTTNKEKQTTENKENSKKETTKKPEKTKKTETKKKKEVKKNG